MTKVLKCRAPHQLAALFFLVKNKRLVELAFAQFVFKPLFSSIFMVRAFFKIVVPVEVALPSTSESKLQLLFVFSVFHEAHALFFVLSQWKTLPISVPPMRAVHGSQLSRENKRAAMFFWTFWLFLAFSRKHVSFEQFREIRCVDEWTVGLSYNFHIA